MLLAVALQAAYFAWALSGTKELYPADLIVSFEGAIARSAAAYRLVDQSYAPNLLISPASPEKLAVYEKRFKPARPYGRITDQLSRTTFENALHTSVAMRDNHFDSVILVTSWDHMPRSYFLLKAMSTWGSQARVLVHAVPTGPLNQANWHQHRIGWMMVYNEMLQFWGSIIELAGYKINGTIPEQVPGESGLAGRLKQMLLFRIDYGQLQG